LEGTTPEEFMKKLAEQNIKSVKFGKDLVRFVTHLDFGDAHLEEFGRRLGKI
jgi:threonine aldolase